MFKKSLSLLFIVLSTISGIFFSLKGKYVHEQMLFNYVAPKIYKVTNQAELGSGTGSLVELESGKSIVLTNRHVCEIRDKDDTVKLIDNSGIKATVKVLLIDNKHDLCAIQAPVVAKGGLKLASKSLGVSDHVFVVGHPSGRPTSLSYGQIIDLSYTAEVNYGAPREGEQCWGELITVESIIKELEKKLGRELNNMEKLVVKFMFPEDLCMKRLKSVMSTAPGERGNSGSPVTDFYGRIVAVLFAGDSSPHMSILVPFEDVKDFLDRVNKL